MEAGGEDGTGRYRTAERLGESMKTKAIYLLLPSLRGDSYSTRLTVRYSLKRAFLIEERTRNPLSALPNCR